MKKQRERINLPNEEWKEELASDPSDNFEPKYIHTRRKERSRFVKERYRKVREIYREYRKYWDEPLYFWVKLDKPIFLYYRKSYRVRDELRNTPEYPMLKNICGTCVIPVKSRRKDFMEKDPKAKKRKVLMPIRTSISTRKYESLSDKEKKEFRGSLCITRWGSLHVEWYPERVWRWDQVKIEPVYATWKGIPNSEAESKHDQLGKQIYSKSCQNVKWLYKAMGWTSHHHDWDFEKDYKKERDLKKQFIQEIIDYDHDKEEEYHSKRTA